MADAAAGFRWQQARLTGVSSLSPRVKSFRLMPAAPLDFLAGQHVDLRLTAPDGYQAQRSYSIASAPGEATAFELAIELMPDGEVSPFFHEIAQPGDDIEFRGPIGGYFNWDAADGGPVLLIGGGSGVVPLVSILRRRAAAALAAKMALVYSARDFGEVLYVDELIRRDAEEDGFSLHLALTREQEARGGHFVGRINMEIIDEALASLGGPPKAIYVCGSNGFVNAANRLVVGAGIDARIVRNERFGGDPAG